MIPTESYDAIDLIAEWGYPDPGREIWYLLAHLWLLAFKSLTTKLQYIEPQKLGIE